MRMKQNQREGRMAGVVVKGKAFVESLVMVKAVFLLSSKSTTCALTEQNSQNILSLALG